MMTNLLRANLVIGSIVVFVAIILLIHRGNLQIKYALAWLTMSLVTVVWAVFPSLVTLFSRALGIMIESNAIFFVMILFCLLVLILLSISASRDNLRVKRLAQELALLRFEIDRLSHGR